MEHDQPPGSPLRVERLPKVLGRIGMGRAWTYKKIQEGRFPRPIRLGARAVGWRSQDIDAWIRARTEQAEVNL
jgi:prophage regulatory protein